MPGFKITILKPKVSLDVRIVSFCFYCNVSSFVSRFQHSRIRALCNFSGKKVTAPQFRKCPYAYVDKFQFKVNEASVFGLTWTPEGIKPDENKIKAICDMPSPKNLTELQSFMGMFN